MATFHCNEHDDTISADETVTRSVQASVTMGNTEVVTSPSATANEIAAVVACLDEHLRRWQLKATRELDENEEIVDGWTIADRSDRSYATDISCMIKSEQRWKMVGRIEKQR